MNLLLNLLWGIYSIFIKPLLFLIDAEKVHEAFTAFWYFLWKYRITRYLYSIILKYNHSSLKVNHFGKNFSNPIGLSAWFDYEWKISWILPCLWFSYESVGTVTNLTSQWNPKPRISRLPKSKSLLINKWFRNSWIRNIISKNITFTNWFNIWLSIWASNSPKITNTQERIDDIIESFKFSWNDKRFTYFELNISCPNVDWVEGLANPNILNELLWKIINLKLSKPLLLKLPIEIEWEEMKEIISIAIKHWIYWVIVGNLAKNRQNPVFDKNEIKNAWKWNFSWLPTKELSNIMIQNIYKEYWDKIIIIWLWGIMNATDAYKKIRLWASMIQMITWMIFKWPQVVSQINRWLVKLMKKDNFNNISEVVWVDSKN